MKKLFIVVPCYNEEEVISETIRLLTNKLEKLIKEKKISSQSKLLFINDGSKDSTWDIIKNSKNKFVTGISLSKNSGHQNALYAGLMEAKKCADIVISMDADLQDDINAIDKMLEKSNKGMEIVYGVRSSRKTDNLFKKNTALLFYKIMLFLGVDIVYNHADYRLMSKRSLDELENFKEVNLFLRGLIPMLGFKSDKVYYERKERLKGKTKYSLTKMFNLAIDGITSFSIKPLRLILKVGTLIFIISVITMIYALIRKLTGNTVPGWTFIAISIWLLGGIQMLSIGVLGEYVGKTYVEVKKRPKYIIDEVFNLN